MPSYLFDTNGAIAWLARSEVLNLVIHSASRVYQSSIVLGELHYGAEKSQQVMRNLQRIDQIAREFSILNCDQETARIFGRVKARLAKLGRPVSPNDNWIAAIAIQYGLTLLTRDADFGAVDGLATQSW
jgi:tRNA(fMet)-specific endonuclease VapC